MLRMVKYLLRSDIRCSHSWDVELLSCLVGEAGAEAGDGGARWPLGGAVFPLAFFLPDFSFLPLLE